MAPLLTIAIPTFNRAAYLQQTLRAIQHQRIGIDPYLLDVLVLDNHSGDNTQEVLADLQSAECPIVIVARDANIGSDANIADAFDRATGRYVWILSDDDFPVPGAIAWLMQQLERSGPALTYMRPYGYDVDPEGEYPGGTPPDRVVISGRKFLRAVGPHITFISSIVVDKSLLSDFCAASYVGNNLVQVEIYLSALLRGKSFLISSKYQVACKRNNSGGYDVTEVFVDSLGLILDMYVLKGLPIETRRGVDRSMLVRFLPQVLLVQRWQRLPMDKPRKRLNDRFSAYPLYWVAVFPILTLPRPLALAFAALVSVVGRVATGDLRRTFTFFARRLRL